jgi:glycosyltransferase involved in cell wall biosynthesis
MTTQPRVTVLIDSYNYGHFIEEAIESVAAQDYPADQFEIVVVDDGSTDDTGERVKKFGSRVRYLYKANGGQASAFNLGFAEARGEILALLDADDYWLPGKLRRVVEEFEKHPEAGMVYHRLQELDMQSGQRREGSFTGISGFVARNRKDLLRYILYPTSALAFRRRCIEPLLPIPEELTIQADSHLSGLVIFVAPVVAIDEALAVYRVHGANLFHSPGAQFNADRTRRRVETFKTLAEGMKEWLAANGRDVSQRDVRAFLAQWQLTWEADEFTIATPGRLRIFWHLWRYNYYFAPRLSWRHMLVNYINAFGSLILGYRHLHFIDEWIAAVKQRIRPSSR